MSSRPPVRIVTSGQAPALADQVVLPDGLAAVDRARAPIAVSLFRPHMGRIRQALRSVDLAGQCAARPAAPRGAGRNTPASYQPRTAGSRVLPDPEAKLLGKAFPADAGEPA